MYSVFCECHPLDSLTKGPGVVNRCFIAFKAHFSTFPNELLLLLAQTFTFRRLEKMNDAATNKRKSDENLGAQTVGGKNRVARFAD